MKESEIHQAFRRYLDKSGIVFDHSRTDKRTTNTVGQPDFQIYARGARSLFIEIKVLGGKLRPEQEDRKCELERLGFMVLICNTVEECVYSVAQFLG